MNGTGIATNSTTRIANCSRSRGFFLAAPHPMESWWRLSNCAITRFSSPANFILNSKANPTNLTHSSKVSSRLRITTAINDLCDVTDYQQALDFLYGLQVFGTKFGLENPRRLADFASNPQGKLRFIHVAGTNGKGSTCAMLESIYRTGGLRVGLFTSPHLVSFRERVQVDRES